MKIENKYPQNASNASNLEVEIFRNKYTNKVSYKNERGVIITLEEDAIPTPTPTPTSSASIWTNKFTPVGCINENITLPTPGTFTYPSPLAMCVGKTLTIPVGTTLIIV